ncbi:MAG TPA: SEC59/DGK1/VTE5 family protein [Bacteroidota bacterium]|nr:SEC59/DGK1/VTE5 family protein [Bacteroidota bacterium]
MRFLQSVEESYATELLRKAIHLLSLLIPVIYYFISKQTALAILVPLTILFAVSDISRLFVPPVGRLYNSYFGFLLRAHERNEQGRRLNGATYVLLAATLLVCFFPKVIVLTAFAILIISDSSAALIGRRFGRHRFLSKSLEGATAFFLSALMVVAFAPKVEYLPGEYVIGAVGAALGAVVEASAIGLDDNLSIPLAVGSTMWLLYVTFLPAVNLFKLDQLI